MAFQEFAYGSLFSFPSLFIALAKELVIFSIPNSLPKTGLSRWMLEFSYAAPEFGPLQAMLMFENSLDCRVRTHPPTLCTFAQNLVHLFRREKPEGMALRCIFPTVCHSAQTHVER
jgi:hypothetical protein